MGWNKVSKLSNTRKYVKVYYTHCMPSTCGHIQGGELQRIYALKYYRSF